MEEPELMAGLTMGKGGLLFPHKFEHVFDVLFKNNLTRRLFNLCSASGQC